jgi:hypothetical protein
VRQTIFQLKKGRIAADMLATDSGCAEPRFAPGTCTDPTCSAIAIPRTDTAEVR